MRHLCNPLQCSGNEEGEEGGGGGGRGVNGLWELMDWDSAGWDHYLLVWHGLCYHEHTAGLTACMESKERKGKGEEGEKCKGRRGKGKKGGHEHKRESSLTEMEDTTRSREVRVSLGEIIVITVRWDIILP